MRLLLDDRYAPITSHISFLEAPLGDVLPAFMAWRRAAGDFRRTRASVASRRLSGDLPTALEALLPLSGAYTTRYLFVATEGPWVAYFDNRPRGGDDGGPVMVGTYKLGCVAVSLVAIPDTLEAMPEGETRGRWGACELWVNNRRGLLRPENTTPEVADFRMISVTDQRGEWRFEVAGGEPYAFEKQRRYKARRVRERFTLEMLADYAGHLGLRPFDEAFYRPEDGAVLVELNGPHIEALQTQTLAEAREAMGLK